MAKFTFDGEVPIVIPTLGLTVSKGDVFEAPDDFTAAGVSPSRAKVTVVANAEPDITDETPAQTSDADAPVDSTTN